MLIRCLWIGIYMTHVVLDLLHLIVKKYLPPEIRTGDTLMYYAPYQRAATESMKAIRVASSSWLVLEK